MLLHIQRKGDLDIALVSGSISRSSADEEFWIVHDNALPPCPPIGEYAPL